MSAAEQSVSSRLQPYEPHTWTVDLSQDGVAHTASRDASRQSGGGSTAAPEGHVPPLYEPHTWTVDIDDG